ncbi:hypothetical protein [Flavobacterium sp.]|uniref:hypothetical protein n=1 Tax=Flavobacterium sp. TaxID=239 RepID=UPI00375168F9
MKISTLKVNYIFFIIVICFCSTSFCQEKPIVKDSTKMYKDIEKYSKKRKFTKFLHKLIFEPTTTNVQSKKSLDKEVIPNYIKFEGKIIRKIKIETLDPFGYSEIDSTVKPKGFPKKAGNIIHDKTSLWAIKNILLYKKNQPLDSLLIKESERLIRSQRFVRRVATTTALTSKNSDSVDIYIRVLDSWSLIPDFTTSTSKSTFKLRERNFLGTGHEFNNSFQQSLKTSDNAFSTSYVIPNFKNTFIKTTLSYEIDLDRNYNKFLAFDRPFFSSFTRWAGGINFTQQFKREFPIDTLTGIQTIESIKFSSQDFWLGRSFRIFKGNTENDRTTNLILSTRFFRTNYIEKPSIIYDVKDVFSNERFYLLGIGIANRKFKQEKFIYNYGVIEDVPTGIVYGFTSGYQQKNNFHRYYFGGRFSFGRFYKFGYLSSNIEYGTFFKDAVSEQNVFSLKLIYFTNLITAGKWKFRQFFKPEMIIGNKRIESTFDRVSLNNNNGIQGFDSQSLLGTKKLLFTFQTQGYSPWNLWGFRLNPFLSNTMGMLANGSDSFKKSKLYTQLGVGLIISNDYLVFNSFQISFSFYPNIPGNGSNVFKTNSFNTEDFGFQDFEFSKPIVVPYQ